MKQTAVDWFWKQIPEILPFTVDTETGIKLYHAYQEAKQMEEQQHRNTFNAGFVTVKWDKENEDVFKQYYDETFNSK